MHARKYVHDESYGRSYLMLLFELIMWGIVCTYITYTIYTTRYLVPGMYLILGVYKVYIPFDTYTRTRMYSLFDVHMIYISYRAHFSRRGGRIHITCDTWYLVYSTWYIFM